MAMNKTEQNTAVKELAVEALDTALINAGATRIDDYTFVIPCEVEDRERFAKVTITACLADDTKTNKAFVLEDAVAKYAEKIADREAAAKAKAEAKAAKEAKKAAKDAE